MIGESRTRTPVAFWTATAIVAATPHRPSSPTPWLSRPYVGNGLGSYCDVVGRKDYSPPSSVHPAGVITVSNRCEAVIVCEPLNFRFGSKAVCHRRPIPARSGHTQRPAGRREWRLPYQTTIQASARFNQCPGPCPRPIFHGNPSEHVSTYHWETPRKHLDSTERNATDVGSPI